ncbi:MAG: hypothetical protein R3B57_05270 [Phycisphaerales bacterium]
MTGDADRATALVMHVGETGARCPACGYSLEGLQGDVCPECGVGLRLTLVRRGRSWPWVFGLMGLAIGDGLLTLALGSLVLMVVVAEWYQYPEAGIVAAIMLVAIAGQSWALARWIARHDRVTAWRAAMAWLVSAGVGAAVWLGAAVAAFA